MTVPAHDRPHEGPAGPPVLPSLSALRVVELGAWVTAPAAAGILSDWGADVIKVEPPAGDPSRALYQSLGASVTENPTFAFDNRGKRSVVLDLSGEADRSRFDGLLDSADVFVTNVRAGALERLGLGPDETLRRHPRLVYAAISGFGAVGPDRDRPSYDVGAFWARTGLSHQLAVPGFPPVNVRGAVGDHATAIAAVAGIMAALFERESSGAGRVVDIALQRVGAYCGGWDLAIQAGFGRVLAGEDRQKSRTPLLNSYRTADDRWLFLTGLEVARHFAQVCRTIGRPDLVEDPRFLTPRDLRRNSAEFIAILDEVFAGRTLEGWAQLFEAEGIWWEPASTPAEVLDDPQLVSNGGFVDVVLGDEPVRLAAGPVSFPTEPPPRARCAPALGAHTDEVLGALVPPSA
ncbi:MAG TPA: CoA transferase [Acidimicrobiales bacterium]|nr:CoA transferase [Acidimicrobiales bacterium]